MSTVNKLASIIGLIQRNQAATLSALSEAFGEDYGHFARSNNREPLNRAAGCLAKGKVDAAIGAAIHAGYKAGALAVGYIGAATGKFKDQPEAVQAGFADAVTRAIAGFTESLTDAGVFADKAPKTDAEKAQAKQDKQDKQTAAIDAAINARIVAGELVRADSVRSELTVTALVDALVSAATSGKLTVENMIALEFALVDAKAAMDASSVALAHVAALVEGGATHADAVAAVDAVLDLTPA